MGRGMRSYKNPPAGRQGGVFYCLILIYLLREELFSDSLLELLLFEALSDLLLPLLLRFEEPELATGCLDDLEGSAL